MHGYKLQKDRERLFHLLATSGIPAEIRQAMERVPREYFLPEPLRHLAYENTALPIGWGQTISQPLTVARMTALLQPAAGLTVLEIGTGSGYQAAVLAALGMQVFTVERDRRLYQQARKRFRELQLPIQCIHRDGTDGWFQKAPYDRILITAATAMPTDALLQQLRPGGLCVFPLYQSGEQRLARIHRHPDGHFTDPELFDQCSFVPLRSSTV